jgi:hypothetical protein
MTRTEDVLYERKQAARDHVAAIKADGCSKCGAEPAEFHHRQPRGPGDHKVSTLVANGVPIERLNREVAKCDLLCRKCHMWTDGRHGALQDLNHSRMGLRRIPEVRTCVTCEEDYTGYTRRGECPRCADRRRGT